MKIEQLLGKVVIVAQSKNKQLIGKTGTIVDETKNTITIQTKQQKQIIPKQNTILKINEKIITNLQGRAEERLKSYR